MRSRKTKGQDDPTTTEPHEENVMAVPAGTQPAIYRDPQDVRTIINLARCGLVLALLLLVSIGSNLYQYQRRPDRIVVDRSSGRVLEINDREFGQTEAIELGPDHLTDADKKYIAGEFAQALYQIDPATRPKDLERALRMMVPDSALKFARYLKEQGILEKQQQESWQSVWTAQDVSVDSHDRYSVRVIGRQDIRRLDNGVPLQEPHQLNLSIKLAADPKGRADRNLRSGFIINSFNYREIQ